MVAAAQKAGPATVALFEAIMKAKRHPEQGFRACLGIIGLVKSYGAERVEAAAKRGNETDWQLSQWKTGADSITKQIGVLDRAIEIMKDYDFEADPASQKHEGFVWPSTQFYGVR